MGSRWQTEAYGKPRAALFAWGWQHCGGRQEQNTGGTPMLQSARRHACDLGRVGRLHSWNVQSPVQSGTLCLQLGVQLEYQNLSYGTA